MQTFTNVDTESFQHLLNSSDIGVIVISAAVAVVVPFSLEILHCDARFTSHLCSTVIQKQIWEISSSGKEPYVITRTSLAAFLGFVYAIEEVEVK